MSLLKRTAIITLKVLVGFVFLIALGVGFLSWKAGNSEIEYERFSVLDSTDGHHSLIIEIGDPRLPYGSHSVAVKVTSASGSEVMAAKNITLANDGMKVDSNNISAHWLDSDRAGVCIRGNEQSDNYLLINLRSLTISETQDKC